MGIGEFMRVHSPTLGSDIVVRISVYWSKAILTRPSAPLNDLLTLPVASIIISFRGFNSLSATSSAAADAIFVTGKRRKIRKDYYTSQFFLCFVVTIQIYKNYVTDKIPVWLVSHNHMFNQNLKKRRKKESRWPWRRALAKFRKKMM